MAPVPARHTVLYDAGCGLCRTALALVLRADRDRRLRPLALGTDEADALLAGLTPAQRADSWHLIAPDGARASAGAATVPLLALLPSGALPARALALMPGTTERAYRWVAAHRAGLGRLIPSAAERRARAAIGRRERLAADRPSHAPGERPLA